MARRRMIDPQIWSDRKLMQTSETARILFIGMFSHADDEGRLPADVTDLKREIFGYNDRTADEIEAALAELQSACKSLAVYEINGDRYVAFRKWKEYQYVQSAKPSKIPAPPRTEDPLSDSSDNDKRTITDDSANDNVSVPDGSDTSIALIEESKKRVEKNKTPFGSAPSGAPSEAEKLRPGAELYRTIFSRYPPKEPWWPRFDAALASVGEPIMRRRLEEWRDKPGCSPTNYGDMLDVVCHGWLADGGGAARGAKPGKPKPWERAL